MAFIKKFGNKELDDKIEEWIRWDKRDDTCDEIKKLVQNDNENELNNRLLKRMAFGTAGLRARMGAGYSMMNDLTIIQTTQGFAKYMLTVTPNVRKNGVVIGFDGRHNSHRFAQRVARVLTLQNIKVYTMSHTCPTPFVPYTVLSKGCDWGIMVTASHNPKDDNGYKVYYSNGAQIIEPHDEYISRSILENLEPWENVWQLDETDNNLCTDVYKETFTNYIKDLEGLCHFKDENSKTDVKFTYTAMHGVGYPAIQKAFEIFNLPKPIPVIEQVEVDPEFTTVQFPNPEEGKSALNLAMKTADENDCKVILANDPDADRLALAEKQANGEWKCFSGNELGSLYLWWLSTRLDITNTSRGDVYAIASTVSSQIIGSIARVENFKFEETLTGFKWMGNKAHELRKKGKTVLFAFEEAIGFMCSDKVLDKDGISAAVVLAEMIIHLAKENLNCKQQLEKIYEKYGQHISRNSYFICHDEATINKLFNDIRNFDGKGKYPSHCGRFEIKYIRDLTTGYDNSQPDNKPILPVSASSQMLTFTFSNGCIATLRTSGTEPKIKYYTEYCAEPGRSREEVSNELNEMIEAIIEHFYRPKENHLTPRPN
ncbi:DgyrCDS7184 [Dimorphilus gyrociliatus]|uniref:DgyrCDS7184 n=1 Tax=Dimorphilus gyrociliatus TaxID=2664684 RepID=A0A7I8VQH7_9ANNE|nr:DgyrCDS7184 [Dimorphilus gyrociliatus]